MMHSQKNIKVYRNIGARSCNGNNMYYMLRVCVCVYV